MDPNVSTEILFAFPPAFTYLGVFIVGFLSNMVIPVPEEIIFIGLGYLVGNGVLHFMETVFFLILGLLINDIVLYTLAKKGNRFLRNIYDKLFREILPLDSPFLKNHLRTVVISSRFLVQLRLLGPFFAGTLKVPLQTFVKWDLFALVIYAPLFVGLGAFFQSRVARVVSGLGSVRNILFIFLGLIAITIVLKYVRRIFIRMFKMAE